MALACTIVETELGATAVVKGKTTHDELHLTIGRLIDPVWEFIRSDAMQPPLVPHHNIVLYRGAATDSPFEVEVGVRVDRRFAETGAHNVESSTLPAGRAARAVHVGPYNRMRETYAELSKWIESEKLETTGVSWEIYGDYDDDPEKLETELYLQLK